MMRHYHRLPSTGLDRRERFWLLENYNALSCDLANKGWRKYAWWSSYESDNILDTRQESIPKARYQYRSRNGCMTLKEAMKMTRKRKATDKYLGVANKHIYNIEMCASLNLLGMLLTAFMRYGWTYSFYCMILHSSHCLLFWLYTIITHRLFHFSAGFAAFLYHSVSTA
jgi:hypothetical protein